MVNVMHPYILCSASPRNEDTPRDMSVGKMRLQDNSTSQIQSESESPDLNGSTEDATIGKKYYTFVTLYLQIIRLHFWY